VISINEDEDDEIDVDDDDDSLNQSGNGMMPERGGYFPVKDDYFLTFNFFGVN
jgi:hypothetical protein